MPPSEKDSLDVSRVLPYIPLMARHNTSEYVRFEISLSPEMAAALEVFRASQAVPPTRRAAVRVLLGRALAGVEVDGARRHREWLRGLREGGGGA